MAKYRAAVIGLGWTGLLYDLGERSGKRFDVDDADRPTPPLDVHREFYYHDHAGNEGLPDSYAEALSGRPEIKLVAGADRDRGRLRALAERCDVQAIYTDAEEMLGLERCFRS